MGTYERERDAEGGEEEAPVLPLPAALRPHAHNRRFKAALRTLDAVAEGVIRERRRSADGEGRGDPLSMLLSARDEETGEGMDDRQLRDEVMTLLLGHETTANALSWTWYLLGEHPEAEERLRAELSGVLGERLPTVEDVPNLRYTRMVIEESMRLYPPVWAIGRSTIAEDEFLGYRIPANVEVTLSAYVTHRHPAFWEERSSTPSLLAWAFRGSPAFRLLPVRRRAAFVHRPGLRAARSGVDRSHRRAALPAAPRTRPSSRVRAPDHAVPPPRPADDPAPRVTRTMTGLATASSRSPIPSLQEPAAGIRVEGRRTRSRRCRPATVAQSRSLP